MVTLGARPDGVNSTYGQQTLNPSPWARTLQALAARKTQARTTPLGGRPSNRWRMFSPDGNPPRTIPRVGVPYVELLPGGRCRRRGVLVYWQCPVSKRLVKTHQPCTKLDCQTCQPAVAKRRGARLAERFAGAPLFTGVFTFPDEYLPFLGVEQLTELRKLLAQLVQSWARSEYGAEVGLVLCLHPTGDRCKVCTWNTTKTGRRGGVVSKGIPAGISGSCPRCGAPPRWRPHFDLLMPLVGLRNGEPIHLPRKPSNRSRDRLKARWADLLLTLAVVMRIPVRERTAAMLCSLHDVKRSVVHFGQRYTATEKGHAFRYSARPFTSFCAGGDLGSLRSPAVYGLAAPGATKRAPGHDADADSCSCSVCCWREHVREPKEREYFECECCAVPQRLEFIDCARRGSEKARLLSFVPDYHGGPNIRAPVIYSQESSELIDGGSSPP